MDTIHAHVFEERVQIITLQRHKSQETSQKREWKDCNSQKTRIYAVLGE